MRKLKLALLIMMTIPAAAIAAPLFGVGFEIWGGTETLAPTVTECITEHGSSNCVLFSAGNDRRRTRNNSLYAGRGGPREPGHCRDRCRHERTDCCKHHPSGGRRHVFD